jgi:hypothetical protein
LYAKKSNKTREKTKNVQTHLLLQISQYADGALRHCCHTLALDAILRLKRKSQDKKKKQ